LLAGLLFGIGLLHSGMTNPSTVLGFLDLAGDWDPSLLLVMDAAIGVAAAPYAWAGRRSCSLLGAPQKVQVTRELDRRLIAGSLLFGIGWGVAGLCPGPALVILFSGYWQGVLFVLAMLAGMLLFTALERWRVF
jgi:uncharacterized membrane protein YedE/YeeE